VGPGGDRIVGRTCPEPGRRATPAGTDLLDSDPALELEVTEPEPAALASEPDPEPALEPVGSDLSAPTTRAGASLEPAPLAANPLASLTGGDPKELPRRAPRTPERKSGWVTPAMVAVALVATVTVVVYAVLHSNSPEPAVSGTVVLLSRLLR